MVTLIKNRVCFLSSSSSTFQGVFKARSLTISAISIIRNVYIYGHFDYYRTYRMNDVQVNFFCPFLRIPIIDRAYNPTSYTNSHQEWNISRQMAEDDIMNDIVMNDIRNVNTSNDLHLTKNKKIYNISLTTYSCV